jgi:cysteine desulfurase
MRVYFDYNATSPVAPEVADAMGRVTREVFGNASSVHHFGQQAKGVLDDARTAVATAIGADPSEVVFTSGGTEADNFAIRGAAGVLESVDSPRARRHLIASAIEHEAVLNTFKALARRGWKTTLLPVDQSGVLTADRLREAITDDTALVSIMHANNEIGTIQPIAELAAIAHGHGALMHTDAVQSLGKIPVDVGALDVDLLSLSAHKFNGPKGVGALWIKRGARVQAILTGGKHERNRRAGTENVPGIAGLGVAATLAVGKRSAEGPRLALLRDRLEDGILAAVPGTAINGFAIGAGAEHDQHQLRPRRSRKPADRVGPRRDCGVDLARPARRVRWSRRTCSRRWVCRSIARRTRCDSVWGCIRHRQKSIASSTSCRGWWKSFEG